MVGLAGRVQAANCLARRNLLGAERGHEISHEPIECAHGDGHSRA